MIPLQTPPVVSCHPYPDMHSQTHMLMLHMFNQSGSSPVHMSSDLIPPKTKAVNIKHKQPMKQMKMLLVEDSKLLREILCDAISHIDNVTVTAIAATQQQAINFLDDTAFDIVLLDIELALGNGFEVIRHFQKDNYAFKAPIVMMLTNHAHPHYRHLAKTLDVPYFFDKSMDFDLAIDAIELEASRFSNTQH